MKHLSMRLTLVTFLLSSLSLSATDRLSLQDTIKTFNMDEIVVTTSSKETNSLRTLPGSVTIVTPRQIAERQVTSIKDISSLVPNLYMPDYGAKLTSAVYIRGVGARSSGQSVGLYVDNAPYMNKSTFDFELTDIQRIEVLRGPQGTLYGRNAMGGIIHVHTLSPLNYQGVKASLSYGNYGQLNAKASIYAKLHEKIGFAAGAYYERCDGFFTNAYDDHKIDNEESVGGNLKIHWMLSPRLTASYTASYEYTDQGGFPYGLFNETTKKIAPVNINDESTYTRSMLANNLSLKYRNENIAITSVTGYQYLDDDMKMDQDFSEKSIFVLNQIQNQHAFTEEVSMISITNDPYQWSFGVYGFYDKLTTKGPVAFKKDGVDAILQPVFDNLSQKLNEVGMPGKLVITNESLTIPGNFKTPSFGVALFHQSTYTPHFIDGLSVTAGIRLDYEKQELAYTSEAKMNIAMQMSPMAPPVDVSNLYDPSVINENLLQQFWQFLPKISLKHACSPRTFTYLSIAKGYKAGGYNVQMSADIMQARMQYDVMDAFKNRMPPNTTIDEPTPVKEVISFQPETSWNYELGARSELVRNRLHAELTFYYLDIQNLQITKFVESGSGRYLSNAGKAESFGAELSLRALFSDEFTADLNYGFTHATFRVYDNARDDFKGNRIPYIPQQTMSIGLNYNKQLRDCRIFDRFFISTQCNGTGKICWNETNRLSQPYYTVVNAQAGARKGMYAFSLWTRNLTNTDYSAFYFESFDKPFMQRGRPFQFGAKISIDH